MTQNVRRTALSNGLTVITEDFKDLETASIGVWVPIGSRHENLMENGISHVLEHMAFRGTATRTSRQIAEQIENVGGYLNAYTSKEATAYYARTLSGDVPLALDLIGDILKNSTFDAIEFEKERTVILQEIAKTQDSPDDLLYEIFLQTAYPNQPMGRPIAGTAAIVERLTPESVKDYMNRHYGASSMILAASGRVDHDAIVAQARLVLGDLPSDSIVTSDPSRYGGGVVRLSKPLGQAHLMVGFEGPSLTHDDYYVASLLSTLLGGGMSSRLYQEIREKRGLAYSVNAFFMAQRDTGMMFIYVGAGEKDLPQLLPLIADELIALTCDIGDDEIRRAKNQLKSALFMGLESAPARCRQLASQMMVHGAPILTGTITDRINAISGDDIQNLCRQMMAGRPTIAALGAIQTLNPNDDALEALFKIQA